MQEFIWLFWVFGVALFLLLLWIVLLCPRLSKRKETRKLLPYAYAHRGYHKEDGTVPENSLQAFRRAVQNGFAIELDVQLTKDGQVVVHHDHSLRRVCGAGVLISDLTYDELCAYTLKNTTERIPLFSQVLSLVNGKVPLLIEIKYYYHNVQLCEKVSALLDTYPGMFCVESFDPRILFWMRRHRPGYIRGQLATHFTKEDSGYPALLNQIMSHLLLTAYTKPDFIAYAYQYRKNISLRLMKRLYHVPEFSWTVTDRHTFRLLAEQHCGCIFEQFDPKSL